MKQLRREYASVAGRSEANQKARVVHYHRVSTLPLTSGGTVVESKQEAERVEDWSSVGRSGIDKTTSNAVTVKCGNQTVLKLLKSLETPPDK